MPGWCGPRGAVAGKQPLRIYFRGADDFEKRSAAVALGAPDQGDADLQAHRELLGHNKIESTVRYLGSEVDDALAIAEQIDV